MDTTQLVLARRSRDLGRDLRATELLLERINADLRERVSYRMNAWIDRARTDIADLQRAVDESADEPAARWAQLHAARTGVDDLIEECLRLTAGAAMRSAELDDGYCELADALVDELVGNTPVEHWGSFTIMGRSEQYSRASRLIQVRAPNTAIWELPIVVHELGHYVGPALVVEAGRRSEHPLDILFEKCGDGTAQSWSWMQELFADVFAAHLLGPAYAYTCAVEVFDPLLAHEPTPTHPPAEQRMRAIVATLRAGDARNADVYAEEVAALWDQLVADSGGTDGFDLVGDSPYAEPLVRLVGEHLRISRWDGWAGAESVRAALTGAPAGPSPGPMTVADALNGAWLARRTMTAPARIDKVGQDTVALIRELVAGGH